MTLAINAPHGQPTTEHISGTRCGLSVTVPAFPPTHVESAPHRELAVDVAESVTVAVDHVDVAAATADCVWTVLVDDGVGESVPRGINVDDTVDVGVADADFDSDVVCINEE